ENGHREVVVTIFLVLEDDAQKLVTDINLSRILLARARLHLHLRVLEGPLEIGVEFSDFVGLQAASPKGRIDQDALLAWRRRRCKGKTPTKQGMTCSTDSSKKSVRYRS